MTILNPQITIVTVCYNSVSTIEKTILSVINQTYSNIEYIIIDGASTDGTLEVIKKYEGIMACWISEPDKGIYDAMNKAVKIAKGDWVFFINSGDLLFDNTVIEKIVPYFMDINTIYYGNVLMVPHNIVYDGEFNKWKLGCRNICHQSIFYPKSVFEKYIYCTKYKIYADYYLNILCYADNAFSFKYVDFVISIYPTDGVSSIEPIDENFRKDFWGILIKNFGFFIFMYSMINIYKLAIINKLRRIIIKLW